MNSDANFCPNCGTAVGNANSFSTNETTGTSDTAKTVATVAGAAVGVSLLSRLFGGGRHRRPPMPPHHPPMPPHRGPMGGHRGPGGRGPR